MCDGNDKDAVPCSLLDSYKNARGQIEHENTLIGHRITWFLAFQGLLFTAFFVALGLLDHDKGFVAWQRGLVGVGAILICCLGIGSAVVCAKLVELAYGQVGRVTAWWKACAKENRKRYPPLYGLPDPDPEAEADNPQPAAGAEKLLYVIGAAWLVLAAIAIGMTSLAILCR